MFAISWIRVRVGLLATLIACAIGGCGGGGSASGTPDLELDRTATVRGVDADSDGVRDDIEQAIDQAVNNVGTRTTLRDYAKALQLALLESASADDAYENAQTAFELVRQITVADPTMTTIIMRITGLTANTEQRTRAYAAFEAQIGGSVFRIQPSAPAPIGRVDGCGGQGYTVAYLNGVNNTFAVASASSTALDSALPDTFNDEPVTHVILYNPTDGLLSDLIEVAKQKVGERWELFWGAFLNDSLFIDFLELIAPGSRQLINDLRNDIGDAIASRVANLGPNSGAVVSEMASTVRTFITEGQKVLIVAHSQGNLFANSVYNSVRSGISTDSVKVVHVATPSSTTSGPYITASSDIVIGAVSSALPSNVIVPVSTADLLGHSFTDIYLNPSLPARSVVLNAVNTTLNAIQAPNTSGSAGFFTVTLTWDGSGDVDLISVEPDGTRVYYNSKVGHSGELDVDNVTANGPEHYYATCTLENLQLGTYQFGINNYARATGRVATVQLSTQNRIHSPVSLGVGEERGSAGNSSPISVFNVLVDLDGQGRKRATLIPTRSRGGNPVIDLSHMTSLPK